MDKKELIRRLNGRIIDQNEYLEKGLYGDKAWGAKQAYTNALELVKKLTIPVVSNQRELLTQFAVFMVNNIEHGKTPASLVNDFYDTLRQ